MLGAWLAILASPLSQSLDDYVKLRADVQAHYVSSYDRTGGNDDGFNGTYSALYVDERGEHVLVDVRAPGTLYNLWFTSRQNGRSPLGFGRIKFYFDDETIPRIDMDADELFSGRNPPFVPPFVFHAFQSTGGYVSYLPLPFAKRLKVTTENRVGFYNAYYHTYTPDTVIESWSGDEDTSALQKLWTRPGEPPEELSGELLSGTFELAAPAMPDGAPMPSKLTLFEHDGAGVIRAFRMNPLFPLTAYQLQHVMLRIYWDGEKTPSIDAPLGSFFGSGLGEAHVRAVPLGMSPSGSYYCYLPMPFWKRARVELTNENPEALPEIWWEARIASNELVENDSGYLNARFRKEWPTTAGKDFEILEADGRGVYVGQVMTVEPLRAEIKRWWEGDMRIYLDGRRSPAFHGTGHEDEYLGGWSNEWLMNPYSLPMHGEPKTTELTQVDFQWSAATTVYRFFVGGIPFQNGIEVSTEHGARNTADAMYSSVAFYYRSLSAPAMEKVAELEVDGPLTLSSEFEGRDDGVSFTDSGRIVSDSFHFELDVPIEVSHLRLRRLFDQSRVQEAEVWVNGERVGIWYIAGTNDTKRWAEADFLLPASVVKDGESLEFEIRPVGRSGEWAEFRVELWGVR